MMSMERSVRTYTKSQSLFHFLWLEDIRLRKEKIGSTRECADELLIARGQELGILLGVHVRADDEHHAVVVLVAIVYDLQSNVVRRPRAVEGKELELAVAEGLPLAQALAVVEEGLEDRRVRWRAVDTEPVVFIT